MVGGQAGDENVTYKKYRAARRLVSLSNHYPPYIKSLTQVLQFWAEVSTLSTLTSQITTHQKNIHTSEVCDN